MCERISIYLPNWSFLYNMALCPWESELRKNRGSSN